MSECFAVLRQIRSIRRSVSRQVLQSMVMSLVLTRLHYDNETLAGVPSTQLDRLQSVMNAAERLLCSAQKSDHVTPLLRHLHNGYECRSGLSSSWLAVLVFLCQYLTRELRRVMDSRRRLCS